MKKYIFVNLCIIIITTILICPVTFAINKTENDGGGPSTSETTTTETNESGTQYEEKLDKITVDVKKSAIVFITLAAVATGFLYMTAAMNPDNKTWAKAALTGLVLGTFVLALSNDIGKLIMGALNVRQSELQVSQSKHEVKQKAKADKWMDGTGTSADPAVVQQAETNFGLNNQTGGVATQLDTTTRTYSIPTDKGTLIVPESGKSGTLDYNGSSIPVTLKGIKLSKSDSTLYEKWVAVIDGQEMYMAQGQLVGGQIMARVTSGKWEQVPTF